ncbi:hypothetical protein OVA24_12620 [Luteolibacter sp. SL250]|uniref:hypothetical protein n=1 Tax=Luteolibacter sp. SL250 TaxID=2995170 RepID=UPI00226F6C54|nr:hypothetical protein [Luteolibacter sp. SL250]WAC18081.1 hypothetical protein OVA24_12620 [Luteolibacter sp. SL250]
MHRAVLCLLLLPLCTCKPGAKGSAQPMEKHQETQIVYPEHFESAWVMSSGWNGYMGVAIALTKDRYYYWMYSDVGNPTDYPFTGSYEIRGDLLLLGEPSCVLEKTPPDELVLYSSSWKISDTKRGKRLNATGDRSGDKGRSLMPDFQFNPKNPFRNQHSLDP